MAVEEGLISRNPTLGIQVKVPRSQKHVLNTEEANILLREAFSVNHRFYDVWALALMTGMRSGEMFALTWKDIDLQTGLISVNKQWTSKDGIALPKNKEARVVPVNDDFKSFLRALRALKKLHRGEYSVELACACRMSGRTRAFYGFAQTHFVGGIAQFVAAKPRSSNPCPPFSKKLMPNWHLLFVLDFQRPTSFFGLTAYAEELRREILAGVNPQASLNSITSSYPASVIFKKSCRAVFTTFPA